MRAFLGASALAVTLAVAATVAGGCGSSGNGSPSSQAATAETSTARQGGATGQFAATIHDDASSFTTALGKVTATCPVPEVTLMTMKQCKWNMQALIRVDDGIRNDLESSRAPPRAATGRHHPPDFARIPGRGSDGDHPKYIDKQDVSGFKGAGGLGSPIDNAINATKAALAQLQLAASSG